MWLVADAVCLMVSDSRRQEAATEWQNLGRAWAALGLPARSRWAHEIADYWRLPWWKALVAPMPSLNPPKED